VQDAALVQTPESEAAGPRRRHSRRRWWLLLSGAVALVLAGLSLIAVEPLWRSLPAPTTEVVAVSETVIPGPPPVLPWPARGQAALDVAGIGTLGSAGSTAAAPIASVTKMMTAYLVLVDHPLAAGQAGPSVPVTAAEVAAYPAEVARSESLVKVAAGMAFTERQALQAVLLPSANNIARVLAEWDAGSPAAFVAKMNSTATSIGMTHTHYTDPAGYDPGSVSTAVDQVVLARKAMALPAFAEIVAQPKATVPGSGTVKNTNGLLGVDGIVGVKTGSTDQALGCLVFAARVSVGGTSLLIVGAVLGQPGAQTPQQLAAVFKAVRPLVVAAGKALTPYTAVKAGQVVARVHGPIGTGTTLAAAADLTVVGWPGLKVRVATDIPQVPSTLAAGTPLGAVRISAGEKESATVPLRSGDRLAPPGAWTRIRHHR
jgi:D-alanyl-D-alanine carboxypeptidase (penicillin-binding protein 5/6)